MTTTLWIVLGVGVGAVIAVVGVCTAVALRGVRHITPVIPETESKPEPTSAVGLFANWLDF